jgi:hypothetical protein
MSTPFTKLDFMDVFARYNRATPGMAFVLVAIALMAALGVARRSRFRDRWASGVLGLLWLWSGVAFHLAFFADTNPAAIAFGILFVVQGLAFFARGVLRHELTFRGNLGTARGITGLLVMTYAIAGYPLISFAVGHRWPHLPTFGAPCPVDLFTLGLLLWTKSPIPRWLLVVPLGWAVVASIAAWDFGMHEDWGLAAAAMVAAAWLWPRGQKPAPHGRPRRPVTSIPHRVWKHASRT